jgi:hypothetical protein
MCTLGECRIATCDANWGHCVGPASDGCETDLRTSSANCGRCGTICGAGRQCFFGACVPLSNYDRAVLADLPVAYFPLDEVSGTTVRDLVGGLVGTVHGAVTMGTGALTPAGGTAMTFAGGHVVVPGAEALGTANFTFELWGRRNLADGALLSGALSMRNGPACAATQGFTLQTEPGAAGRWLIYSGTRTPPTGLCWDSTTGGPTAVDVARHVVGAYDGAVMRLYVDGAQAAQIAAVFVPFGGTLYLGAVQNVPGGAVNLLFSGVIDNVALYDRALDATTIMNHFNAAR